jgi:hypothetical protein
MLAWAIHSDFKREFLLKEERESFSYAIYHLSRDFLPESRNIVKSGRLKESNC